jgi:sigma-B regulation protein RsbU (phosphoserine phosphatase)
MIAEGASLLIVDDEELSREGLARRLQRQGYGVTTARSGREALELLGTGRFDLVLLDVMMPGMNGLEVLKLLRRVDSLIDLPIIMVTARGDSSDVVEALELGANDYLTKPLDFPVVLARIRTQLTLKRAVGQITELEEKLHAPDREGEVTAARMASLSAHIKGDREAAARIQKTFLPALPGHAPGFQFVWAFEPSCQLTGDCMNVFRLDDRHVGLSLLDVNGNGVTGALLAVTASHLLACSTRGEGMAVLPPAEVVSQLSKRLAGGSMAGQLVTLLHGVLDQDSGELRYVSAGHPGPIQLPCGSAAVSLAAAGWPVGVGNGEYREQALVLQPGDRLVLHSDGLTAVRNPEGEHFGMSRLLNVLEQARSASLADSLAALLADVEKWRGDTPRQEDLSVLLVERVAVQSPARSDSPGATR